MQFQTKFRDAIIRGLDSTFRQIIILGAGNDSRFHRIPQLPFALIEVDAPKTQAAKLKMLTNCNSNVKFVPGDFECESWIQNLGENGFQKDQKTLFLWEGVIYFLTPADIQSTLESISECAKGSKLVQDYLQAGRSQDRSPSRPLPATHARPRRAVALPHD